LNLKLLSNRSKISTDLLLQVCFALIQLWPGLQTQTAAVAIAGNVGSVDNVAALDIYVAVTGVDNAVVGIPVAVTGIDNAAVDNAAVDIPVAAAAAGGANAACVLSNNSAARHWYLHHRIASCSQCRVLHCAMLSIIKHTAELSCGKGLAAGICPYNGRRRLNGLAGGFFSQVRNRGALCPAGEG
jgi:hypothetical protein